MLINNTYQYIEYISMSTLTDQADLTFNKQSSMRETKQIGSNKYILTTNSGYIVYNQ